MKISTRCIELIKQFEGCRLTAYKPVPTEKYWTIGYGHYGADVAPNMKITQVQADQFLVQDLAKFEKKVNKYSKYNWTQYEFDALVSFAYNIGSIDQLTANGTRDKVTIARKMLEYNKAGGKVLNGLVRRRQAEHDLFTSGNNWTRKTVRFNDRGYLVKELQIILSALDYPVGKTDGIFGNKTLQCVKEFQKDNGLVVDGIVGLKTWTALDSLIK